MKFVAGNLIIDTVRSIGDVVKFLPTILYFGEFHQSFFDFRVPHVLSNPTLVLSQSIQEVVITQLPHHQLLESHIVD